MAGPISVSVHSLFSCSPSSPPPPTPTLAERLSRFYFVCTVHVALSLYLFLLASLSQHPPLFLSFSFVGRKWFMAVPERRFRRESCVEDRPPAPLYPASSISPGPAALFATLLCSAVASQLCRGFSSSRWSFLYARDHIVRSLSAQ